MTPATRLGSATFRRDLGIAQAYVAGSMYRGIASKELVLAMGRHGFLGFLGAAGLSPDRVAGDIEFLRRAVGDGVPFGVNLLHDLRDPARELAAAELLLRHDVRIAEASAFVRMTPGLVLFHLRGLRRSPDGAVVRGNRLLAKISRPEVAAEFLRPAPPALVSALLAEGRVTAEQAELAAGVAVSQDLCVEADSGGHTDRGAPMVLLPAIQSLRDAAVREHGYTEEIRVGLAGGIGTSQAVAAAFAMGADFVLTGSVNQCTVESGISDGVKDRLQSINVQDTGYCPAGDMFEIGAQVQVLKKGVLFPARANRLLALYREYGSWDEIPAEVRQRLEQAYFKRGADRVWQEIEERLRGSGRLTELDRATTDPRYRLSLIFRWYYGYSSRLSFTDPDSDPANLQVHTGPALGAFNQRVRGTPLENWRNRRVARIAEMLMHEGAELLHRHAGTAAESQGVTR